MFEQEMLVYKLLFITFEIMKGIKDVSIKI